MLSSCHMKRTMAKLSQRILHLHVQAGSISLAGLDSSAAPGLYSKYGLDAPKPRGQEADAQEEEDVGPEVNGVDAQGGSAASRRHLSAAERKALKKVGHAPTYALHLMFTSWIGSRVLF